MKSIIAIWILLIGAGQVNAKATVDRCQPTDHGSPILLGIYTAGEIIEREMVSAVRRGSHEKSKAKFALSDLSNFRWQNDWTRVNGA